MFTCLKISFSILAIFVCCVANPTASSAQNLPERQSQRPETTTGVPHVQIGIENVPALTKELLRRVSLFPGVKLGETRVSLPGAVGFQLDPGLTLANPNSVVGGLEFAHVHPDGSLHASLHPDVARDAISKGWAIEHPWSKRREGWEGFVMIYTPQTESELETDYALVAGSYTYITGRNLP